MNNFQKLLFQKRNISSKRNIILFYKFKTILQENNNRNSEYIITYKNAVSVQLKVVRCGKNLKHVNTSLKMHRNSTTIMWFKTKSYQ